MVVAAARPRARAGDSAADSAGTSESVDRRDARPELLSRFEPSICTKNSWNRLSTRSFCTEREAAAVAGAVDSGVGGVDSGAGGADCERAPFPTLGWLPLRWVLDETAFLNVLFRFDSAFCALLAASKWFMLATPRSFAIRMSLQNAMTSSEEGHVSRKQRATASRGH